MPLKARAMEKAGLVETLFLQAQVKNIRGVRMYFVHNGNGHIKPTPSTYQLRKGEIEDNPIALVLK